MVLTYVTSQTVGGAFLLLPLLFLGRCVYNVYLHPLRKFPGPVLARASRLYFAYYKIKGRLPFKIKELHDEYGNAVRIAPDELSYINAEAWQDITGHRSGSKQSSFAKDPKFYFAPENNDGRVSSIVNANDEDHRRMRRLQSHAFSERALLSQEPVLNKYVDMLIKRLHEHAAKKQAVDIVKWYNFTTFDLIGDLAFGRSFNCLSTGEMHYWIEMIFNSLRIGNFFQSLRYVSQLLVKAISMTIPKPMSKKRKAQFRFAQDMMEERIGAGVTRDDGQEDFMSYILRANDDKGMSYKEMVEAANIYIVAGSETTASLLSGLTYHLLCNPRVYKKLEDEIRGAFKTEGDIKLPALSQLPYLNAVFEEALRIYPPAPSTLPRNVPRGGELVCGEFIPEKTVVGLSNWAVNHSSSNFSDPDTFTPERWLGDVKYENDNRKAFQPFSFGPRNCIGRNLAYSEMRLILGRVLWNFDLEMMPESVGWAERQRIFILWEKGPLNVRLTARGTKA